MIIRVYDRYFRRIDILKKYTYCQITDKVRDIGTFTVNVVLDSDSEYLLDESQTYYLHFKDEYEKHPVMGEILKAKKDSEEEQEIIKLEGKLCINVFAQRVIEKTQNYYGTIPDIMQSIVETNISGNPSTSGSINPRYIDIRIHRDIVQRDVSGSVSVQKTGDLVSDVLFELAEQKELCLDFYPTISGLHQDEHLGSLYPETNISKWNLDIITGDDRTRRNSYGNVPLVFSQSYSNIERVTYEVDRGDYKNVAYVAGEGEGEQRRVEKICAEGYEENSVENIGFQRREMYVDARDLQKETEDGETITEEEYKNLLAQRGTENLLEHIVCMSYDGTMIVYNTKGELRYTYGKDFYKGDKVEIIDNSLGVKIVAQITAVTRTYQKGQGTIFDIEFGNKKYTLRKRKERKGRL